MYIKKGELRKVGISVSNNQTPGFIIEFCDYEIFKNNGELIEKGSAKIENHDIYTYINHDIIEDIYIVFSYGIADEILKAKIQIHVR